MLKGVETSVEEGVEKNNVDRCSCRGFVEGQFNRRLKEARSIHNCREAIEDPGTFLIDPPSFQGSIEIAIRKKFKSSTNS